MFPRQLAGMRLDPRHHLRAVELAVQRPAGGRRADLDDAPSGIVRKVLFTRRVQRSMSCT